MDFFNHKNMRKIMFLIGFTILLLVGVWRLDSIIKTISWVLGILRPFIIGGCIAFVLCIPMKMFERVVFRKGKTKNKILMKLSRPLSIILSIVLVFGIVFFVFFIIVPEVGQTITNLGTTIPGFVTKAQNWIMDKLHEVPKIEDFIDNYEWDWSKLSTDLLNITSNLSNILLNSASTIIGIVVSAVTNFLIGLVFAIYLLANKEKLCCQAKKIMYSYLPAKRADRILMILQITNKTFANYVSGQCIEAVILGMMFFVTLSIFRFPYPLMISVLVAFTALIPILGAYIGSSIATFLIFMVSPIQALWFILVFNILQQIEDNFIYPHVVGGSIGLPSIWVLFSLTVGGSLMGIKGMIVFIPLFSVFYQLLRENVNVRLLVRHVPETKWRG